MDFYLLSVVVFAAVIVLILFKDRKNVERQSVMFLRKTQRGKATIIKIGTSFRRFWKVVGTIGVVTGFIASMFIFYWLVDNLLKVFTTETVSAGLAIVLPAATTTANIGPGYLLVPFWYWIISIGLLVLVHEGFHGIMAAMENVRIRSLGWGVLAILPLAFVEPDEKQIAKKSTLSQLRVYAAGSFANFLLALLAFSILTITLPGLFMSSGVGYQGLITDYPADLVNISGGIIAINGQPIQNTYDLDTVLSSVGSGKTIDIKTYNGKEELEFTLETASKPVPLFKPSFMDNLVASIDSVIPNTIDFSKSIGALSEKSWTELKMEIQYWEYMKDNYPHLEQKASKNIMELEQEVEQLPEPGFIGIIGVYDVNELKTEFVAFAPVIEFTSGLLFFLFLINLGVGLANLLPIKPLDGGRMWHILLVRYIPKKADSIMKIVSWATLLILVGNFVIPMLF
ncbi:MAG: site-2 protease family protein [Nanoarchaeota archaeon]